ncbi:uncharacterized protein SEPMUDRAFT_120502 [Sphaerulina musiva SO2202]|uniref:Uncharacterized protein n=1 Tax=Sphaerulina musiva (strain SO2202) TaxID=692275 RepID=N1QI68_SPHMS|nr:uncharacterized protein SEPMUDRAFT_120502 [Sphaerulina musiva SO2202]EMF09664.1 hypothetical protein SEPMUDRAFT_120502 [Sphaerulina musiva SO2202]
MPKRKSNALEALANKRAKLGAASKSLEEYSLKPNTLRDRERTAAIDEEKRVQDRYRKARNESFARFKKAQIKEYTSFESLAKDEQQELIEGWRKIHTKEYDQKATKKQTGKSAILPPNEQAKINKADWFLELGDIDSKERLTF